MGGSACDEFLIPIHTNIPVNRRIDIIIVIKNVDLSDDFFIFILYIVLEI
jgi:hypothetical protein